MNKYVTYFASVILGFVSIAVGAYYYFSNYPDASLLVDSTESSKMSLIGYLVTVFALITFLISLVVIRKLKKQMNERKILNNSLQYVSIILIALFGLQVIYFFQPAMGNMIRIYHSSNEPDSGKDLLWPEFKKNMPEK